MLGPNCHLLKLRASALVVISEIGHKIGPWNSKECLEVKNHRIIQIEPAMFYIIKNDAENHLFHSLKQQLTFKLTNL
jgi:hypothetical protein